MMDILSKMVGHVFQVIKNLPAHGRPLEHMCSTCPVQPYPDLSPKSPISKTAYWSDLQLLQKPVHCANWQTSLASTKAADT